MSGSAVQSDICGKFCDKADDNLLILVWESSIKS